MNTTTRKPFTPNVVWIPDAAVWHDKFGEHIEQDECELLMLDSDDNTGYVYTKETWESGNEDAEFYRRSGTWEANAAPIVGGTLELLPDLWVVKINERSDYEKYCSDKFMVEKATRIFGVYVFDRRRQVNCCSFDVNYELFFLGTQYDCGNCGELTEEESERLCDAFRNCDNEQDDVKYYGVRGIDAIVENECREHFLPGDTGGGFRLTGIVAKTYDAMIEEAREAYRSSEF